MSYSALPRRSLIGFSLFAIYCLAYGTFMAVNVLAPELMAKQIFNGVNVAIHSGFGLIGLAILLSFAYMFVPRGEEKP